MTGIPKGSKISNLESNLSEKKNGDRCGSIAAWLNSRTRAEISIASLRWMRSEAVACNSIWNAFGNADSRCLQPPDVSYCRVALQIDRTQSSGELHFILFYSDGIQKESELISIQSP